MKKFLSTQESVWVYPLIISLTYQKNWYWIHYLKGRSVKKSCFKKLEILEISCDRRLRRGSLDPKALKRLDRLRYYHRLKHSVLATKDVEIINAFYPEYIQ
jgi:hypothetical protein